jgi:hypothetical protein
MDFTGDLPMAIKTIQVPAKSMESIRLYQNLLINEITVNKWLNTQDPSNVFFPKLFYCFNITEEMNQLNKAKNASKELKEITKVGKDKGMFAVYSEQLEIDFFDFFQNMTKRYVVLNLTNRVKIGYQLAKAISIMNQEYTHCDIKFENIMIKAVNPSAVPELESKDQFPFGVDGQEYYLPHLIDFGLATKKGSKCIGGTNKTLPAEFYRDASKTDKYDVFALGVSLMDVELMSIDIMPVSGLIEIGNILRSYQKNKKIEVAEFYFLDDSFVQGNEIYDDIHNNGFFQYMMQSFTRDLEFASRYAARLKVFKPDINDYYSKLCDKFKVEKENYKDCILTTLYLFEVSIRITLDIIINHEISETILPMALLPHDNKELRENLKNFEGDDLIAYNELIEINEVSSKLINVDMNAKINYMNVLLKMMAYDSDKRIQIHSAALQISKILKEDLIQMEHEYIKSIDEYNYKTSRSYQINPFAFEASIDLNLLESSSEDKKSIMRSNVSNYFSLSESDLAPKSKSMINMLII